MRRKLKRIALAFSCSILVAVIFTGCSKKDKTLQAFEAYKAEWVEQDFESMYSMLSSEAQEYIDKDTFLERYTNIYDAIEVQNIDIIVDEENRDKKSLEIPFSIKMNTMVGEVELTGYKATLVEEEKAYKMNWNEALIFPQMQEGDKVRVKDSYAKRGTIFDRNGEYLATDGVVKSIGIHPSKFENEKEAKINSIAEILDISKSYIEEKLAANTNPEHFVPLVTLLETDYDKIDKLSTIEGIIVNNEASRIYAGGEAFGSLVGYVAPITAEELEENKDKGYSPVDLIGKAGLEKVFEADLRGQDGGEIYIERGEEKISVASREPVNGKDIKTAIDPKLQSKIYGEMKGEKGAATAVDPKTGEVLAMVSSPSFDPNVFTTYKTKTTKEAWDKLNGDQFDNRFNNVYAPGSTMKLITAAIGLNNGTLSAGATMDINGLQWQKDASWGGYKITRVKDTSKPINLIEATKYSDNIYYARAALDIGADKYIEGAKNFGIGEELTFEYPMENSQISNDGSLKKEILLADTGYGQGEVLMSPLNMAMAYSALGNDGDIMVPRLVLDEANGAQVYKNAIKKENVKTLVDAFSAVINDSDGTAVGAKVTGHNIAGKTGTAEIKQNQDDKDGKENGWFAAVDTDQGKLSIAMIIEDVKDRGGSGIPTSMVQKVMEYYLNEK